MFNTMFYLEALDGCIDSCSFDGYIEVSSCDGCIDVCAYEWCIAYIAFDWCIRWVHRLQRIRLMQRFLFIRWVVRDHSRWIIRLVECEKAFDSDLSALRDNRLQSRVFEAC